MPGMGRKTAAVPMRLAWERQGFDSFVGSMLKGFDDRQGP